MVRRDVRAAKNAQSDFLSTHNDGLIMQLRSGGPQPWRVSLTRILDDQFCLCAAIKNNPAGRNFMAFRSASFGFAAAYRLHSRGTGRRSDSLARRRFVPEGSFSRQAHPRAVDGGRHKAHQRCRDVRALSGAAARQGRRHAEADAGRRRRYRLYRARLCVRQDAGVGGRDAAGRFRAFLSGNAGLFEAREERRRSPSRIMPPTASGCCSRSPCRNTASSR